MPVLITVVLSGAVENHHRLMRQNGPAPAKIRSVLAAGSSDPRCPPQSLAFACPMQTRILVPGLVVIAAFRTLRLHRRTRSLIGGIRLDPLRRAQQSHLFGNRSEGMLLPTPFLLAR